MFCPFCLGTTEDDKGRSTKQIPAYRPAPRHPPVYLFLYGRFMRPADKCSSVSYLRPDFSLARSRAVMPVSIC
jgi:hypothetical protein